MSVSSSENRNTHHGAATKAPADSQPEGPWGGYWTWICCCCTDGPGGMTTNVPMCPNPSCQHARCENCEVEQHPPRNRRLTDTSTPSRSKVDSTSRKLKAAQHSTETPLLSCLSTGSEPIKKAAPKPRLPSDQRHIFACPFHKNQPHKYNPHANPDYFFCTKPGWPELKNLVKDHLQRVHRPPKCSICQINHFGVEPCGQSSSSGEGISDEQWKQILDLHASKTTSHYDKWAGIWSILFPKVALPSNTANENPWTRSRLSVYIVDSPLSEPVSLTAVIRSHVSHGHKTRKVFLALQSELTQIFSHLGDNFSYSFDMNPSPEEVPSPVIDAANLDKTPTLEPSSASIPYFSQNQDLSSLCSNISSYSGGLVTSSSDATIVGADHLKSQEYPTTIFNPSEALSIPVPQDLPPIPNSVFLPGYDSFSKEDSGDEARVGLCPDRTTLSPVFDAEPFGLDPDLTSPYFNATENLDHHSHWDDCLGAYDGESNQFDLNESHYLDMSDHSELEGEMPDSMEYQRDKNDGERYPKSLGSLWNGG